MKRELPDQQNNTTATIAHQDYPIIRTAFMTRLGSPLYLSQCAFHTTKNASNKIKNTIITSIIGGT